MTMNRRTLICALPAAAVFAGCNSTPSPSATASLTNSDDIKNAVDKLDSLAGDLEQNAEDFDDDNWRDIVPEVKENVESLRSAIDDLMVALGYKQS